MKQIIIAVFILTAAVKTSVYSQVNEKPKVSFTVSKVFWKVKGSFKEVEYDIHFNPKDIKNSKISGKVNISSIHTSDKNRDEHIQADKWFDAAKYPAINISSLKIEYVSDMQYKGLFDISIKGISKEESIPFKIVEQNKSKYFVCDFTISLKDYDIGGGAVSHVVGDEVEVSLHIPI